MVNSQRFKSLFMIILLLNASVAFPEQAGSIRGMVYDKDFEVPLAAAQILIAETGEKVTSTDGGNFVLGQVKPGTYTIVFSKDGYTRQVKANVVVSSGQMTEVEAWLSGEFTEMEEFVVQDIQVGTSTEASLLDLRMESPALMDSISSDLMSRAGAGDAASALRLVSGATVQDGKYAVIRGLPDRYVNSQMNGVRLPTSDSDKRAVQLDQFPSAIIESIQVTKTFTPDQQGDASGGAVNVVLKGIPNERIMKFESGMSFNTNVTGNNKFLTHKGGDLGFFGKGGQDLPVGNIGNSWANPVGVSTSKSPEDYKWSAALGDKFQLDKDIKIGVFGSFFHERDVSYFENGVNDKYWVKPGDTRMTPQYIQGTPDQGDFKTQLFDMTQASQEIKWGKMGALGLETENHSLTLMYMYTNSSMSKTTLAEDTRGKNYYFPGYDQNDPLDPGNQQRDAAPYIRTETLAYTKRITRTFQFRGTHNLDEYFPDFGIKNFFMISGPELDWGVSKNKAALSEDKHQFGSLWWADKENPGYPIWGIPPSTDPAVYRPYKPAANYTLGNVQHVWKNISEESEQWYLNLKIPFEQWSGDEGYFKTGWFNDKVFRKYDQNSYSNFNDNSAQYEGSWEEYWSNVFPYENHPITAADIDVDYTGHQNITAWYYMADLPLWTDMNLIGGFRHEHTELGIVNDAEKDVTWVPPGATGEVKLNPGDADVSFEQDDILPSIGFVFKPIEKITLRGTYSETVARQTFKELTPIKQQEYLGGDVFVGNPNLKMSALKNYDLRLDYEPYDGGLFSASYFVKNITDPIEYVQRRIEYSYTTAENYPKGKITGFELETRHDVGKFWKAMEGFTLGANATLIDSKVKLPKEEAIALSNIGYPMTTRDMTNAPEYLYNIFMTYDITPKTQVSLFYTVRGDTLIAGAGQSSGNFIPNVYEKEYGTLNFGLVHELNDIWKLKFQAKNLLDPKIESVYRFSTEGDITKTSYRKGMEFSISISAEF